ncbi:MAG TPA: NYN domain-containing protein [Clostridia bacterium]|nr:NYN domain-containing protein [Clostridia bacterium]
MTSTHFAIFVDLENCGAKAATLNYIIERVKIRGDILLGKVYGYTDRYSDLKELLLSNTFNVVPSLRFGHHQKNNLDIQLVIDALEVAYTNPLIDSFCIVSGDSDYTPLVGKLKTMGKFVLGISRSEVASAVFITACNEFLFLESVTSKKKQSSQSSTEEPLTDADLAKLVETILDEAEEDDMYASELKSTILRLRPDFNEKSFGCASFGKLLLKIEQQFGNIQVVNDHYNVIVNLRRDECAVQSVINKDNFVEIFQGQLNRFKEDGFDRINPSILKATIQNDYPSFNERTLGYKRFSDLMKYLEKRGLVKVELDEQKTMLIHIL